MKKWFPLTAAAIALAAPGASAQAALGPEAGACTPGTTRPAVLVKVTGFKTRTGNVRVQIYNQSNFLVKGQRVKRIDLPVSAPTMPICVALPGPGTYAVAVRHDVNGNNKSRDFSDGGGFSRNPKLSILALKPSFSEVSFGVGNGAKQLSVILNYKNGLSVGPVGR